MIQKRKPCWNSHVGRGRGLVTAETKMLLNGVATGTAHAGDERSPFDSEQMIIYIVLALDTDDSPVMIIEPAIALRNTGSGGVLARLMQEWHL